MSNTEHERANISYIFMPLVLLITCPLHHAIHTFNTHHIPSRLHTQRLQPHHPPLLLLNPNNIILTPRPINSHLKHPNLPTRRLPHRINNLSILLLKRPRLNLFNILIATQQFL